jgi:ethanolamine ammonia-lyase small subunit
MSMEDNLRLLVEQVLKEMNGNPSSGAPVTPAAVAQSVVASAQGAAVLPDLAEVDLQNYLQVPNPKNRALYAQMKLSTPARIGVWRAGVRPLTDTLLRFRADHAVAQDSVLGEVADDFIQKYGMVSLSTECSGKDQYLTRPDLGRRLCADSVQRMQNECQANPQVQIIVSDGLSSKAIEANLPDILPALEQGLKSMGISIGKTAFVKYGRVAVVDQIGDILKPEALVLLIGERPGLGTAESMSAYMAYRPHLGMVESERSVISNIHKGGTPPAEAGAHLATFVKRILDAKASGVDLK